MCFGEKIRRGRRGGYSRTYTSESAGRIQRRPVSGKAFSPRAPVRKRRSREELDPDYVEPASGGNRTTYMGSTPPKFSEVGKQVIQNMLEQHIVDDGTWLVEDDTKRIYLETNYAPGCKFYLDTPSDARLLHMGHLCDAVTFWNEIGRFTGPKSKCVLDFMHDSNNYLIQYGPRNCQRAPHEGYLPPADRLWEDFDYIPCAFVGDKANFALMKKTLIENGYI